MRLSELAYYTGIPDGIHECGSFDPQSIEDGEIETCLNSLWDEMNDLCNQIAKALDSDGPSSQSEARVSEGAKNSLSQPALEDL